MTSSTTSSLTSVNYHKFKVDDKVKIVGKSVGTRISREDLKKQMVGKVYKIYGDGSGADDRNCICVKVKNYGGNYFAPQDLKLINKTIYITHKEYLKLKKI